MGEVVGLVLGPEVGFRVGVVGRLVVGEVVGLLVRPEVGFRVGVVGRLVLGRLVLGREVGRAVVGCADMVGAHVTPGMTR